MQESYPPAEVQLGPTDKEKTLPAGFLVFPLKWVLGDLVGSLTSMMHCSQALPTLTLLWFRAPPLLCGNTEHKDLQFKPVSL